MKALTTLMLITTFAGVPDIADAQDLPASCCPTGCKAIDEPVTLGVSFVTATFPAGDAAPRTIPLADNVVYGRSPDARYHICIRYTDFGDEEIKCILTPMLM